MSAGAKGSVAVVVAVIGWALVCLSVANSWAILTARETVVGPTGLLVGEMVRIAPALVYFLLVGVFMAQRFGWVAAVRWAALAAAIAMALEALAERQVFFGGVDPLAVAVLSVDYLLPVAAAIGGALIARVWQRPKGGTVAT